jgi:hypothetical protein
MAVREECDPRFMIGDDQADNTYTRLLADPALLCRVIFVLCDKQRMERGVSEEAFYLGVIGDAIDAATTALIQAIVTFTPGRTRQLLEASIARSERLQQAVVAKAMEKIDDPAAEARLIAAVQPAIDAALEGLLAKHS